MTQTTFTDNVEIQGSQDITQLKVVAAVDQTEALQTWETSGNDVLIQITADGRLEIGELGIDVPNTALGLETNLDATSSTQPKRGWHTLGHITGALTDAIIWAVNELELLGTGGVSGLQTALRAKLTHDNSGSATSAELRAGDFEVVNQTGTSLAPVGKATGIHGLVSNTPSGANAVLTKAIGVEGSIQNATDGTISEAAAFEVAPPLNDGTIDTLYGLRVPDLDQATANYALYTGAGSIHFGDLIEMEALETAPAANLDATRLYVKTDGKLYIKTPDDEEFDLTSGEGGGANALADLTDVDLTDVAFADTLIFDGLKWIPQQAGMITDGFAFLTDGSDYLGAF